MVSVLLPGHGQVIIFFCTSSPTWTWPYPDDHDVSLLRCHDVPLHNVHDVSLP